MIMKTHGMKANVKAPGLGEAPTVGTTDLRVGAPGINVGGGGALAIGLAEEVPDPTDQLRVKGLTNEL